MIIIHRTVQKNIKFFGLSTGFVAEEIALFHSFPFYIQYVR